MLIEGYTATYIANLLAGEYGVSTRMIRKDAERIYRVWDIEDREALRNQRALFFRRISKLARKAESTDQLTVVVQLEALRLRAIEGILGGVKGQHLLGGDEVSQPRTIADAATAAERAREKRQRLRITVREAK